MLYRLFPYDPEASPTTEGGALHVPRALQGGGRHDNPDRYGAVYASRRVESVVAEWLRRFRDRPVTDTFLRWGRGMGYAVAALDEALVGRLVDLDDPRVLADRALRPSGVATGDREVTQGLALALYGEGAPGFEWWSTIEGSWINVTLFADRALEALAPAGDPEVLTVRHPAVVAAADVVGVTLQR